MAIDGAAARNSAAADGTANGPRDAAFLDASRDAVAVAAERPMLEAFLDCYRDAIARKASGLSEQDTRRQLVGSNTTIAGLVKHLRVIEMNWFQRILGRTPDSDLPEVSWDDYADSSFVLEPNDTIDDLVAAYHEQCALSREIAGRHQLTDTAPHPQLGEVSLRWIYLHMIDETARHLGHADILREQTDGQTGH